MDLQKVNQVADEAIDLLRRLIATPSFSREEGSTGDLIESYLHQKGLSPQRDLHNIWVHHAHFDAKKPTYLLNSHHDTVLPNPSYTLDPFEPLEKDGKLYGLGSNDAGASLVALLATFLYFQDEPDMPFNLVYAASAEEEISGANGIERLVPHLGKIDGAIVGEPTQMQLAIAEKGLMVVDIVVHGKTGHAAREEGDNALYKAVDLIQRIRNYHFEEVSPFLGPVKMSTTIIQAGSQHNVVPETCRFTVDVRVNECYSLESVLDVVRSLAPSNVDVTPRSLRMRSSMIPVEHPLVQAGLSLGRSTYGSPTTSDKALMPFPALKMGPGDSARSHSADEFIYIEEIREGIRLYVELLSKVHF